MSRVVASSKWLGSDIAFCPRARAGARHTVILSTRWGARCPHGCVSGFPGSLRSALGVHAMHAGTSST